MIIQVGILFIALIVIVASSELFTNGIEWLGQRLQLSEGVVGSVLAAVGTALPETLIPIVAVVFFGQRHGADVGIGAIAGAPFMLSTLTLGLCGLSGVIFARMGKRPAELTLNKGVICRDLKFFIAAYTVALIASFATDMPAVRYVLAVILLFVYPLYLLRTFQHEGEVGEAPEVLHFDRLFNIGPNRLMIIVPQVLTGLLGILGGAYIFVDRIQDLADDLNFPPLVLSLIISPIATELPEKINSILWTRSGKDTLAVGNITGALVFQSCFPVAFGVAFTSWHLDMGILMTGVVAIVSAAAYLALASSSRLTSRHLVTGSLVYALSVGTLMYMDWHEHEHPVMEQAAQEH